MLSIASYFSLTSKKIHIILYLTCSTVSWVDMYCWNPGSTMLHILLNEWILQVGVSKVRFRNRLKHIIAKRKINWSWKNTFLQTQGLLVTIVVFSELTDGPWHLYGCLGTWKQSRVSVCSVGDKPTGILHYLICWIRGTCNQQTGASDMRCWWASMQWYTYTVVSHIHTFTVEITWSSIKLMLSLLAYCLLQRYAKCISECLMFCFCFLLWVHVG